MNILQKMAGYQYQNALKYDKVIFAWNWFKWSMLSKYASGIAGQYQI